jgi:hypothetical protein
VLHALVEHCQGGGGGGGGERPVEWPRQRRRLPEWRRLLEALHSHRLEWLRAAATELPRLLLPRRRTPLLLARTPLIGVLGELLSPLPPPQQQLLLLGDGGGGERRGVMGEMEGAPPSKRRGRVGLPSATHPPPLAATGGSRPVGRAQDDAGKEEEEDPVVAQLTSALAESAAQSQEFEKMLSRVLAQQ